MDSLFFVNCHTWRRPSWTRRHICCYYWPLSFALFEIKLRWRIEFVAIVEERSLRRAAIRVSEPLGGQASSWPADFFKLCRKRLKSRCCVCRQDSTSEQDTGSGGEGGIRTPVRGFSP